MKSRRSLLRRTTVLALAVAIIGTGTFAPAVSASTLDSADVTVTVHSTMNKPKVENDEVIPGLGDLGIGDVGSGVSDIGDIPIIGDVANTFKDAEPEEIVTGAVQFAGVAAETIVPLIRGLIK
jgi:hypothetical protein